MYHLTTVNRFLFAVRWFGACWQHLPEPLQYWFTLTIMEQKVLKSAALSREQRGNFVKTFTFCDLEVFIPQALKLNMGLWVNVLPQFHVCSENKTERNGAGVGSMVEASGIGEHLFDLWKVLEGTFLNDVYQNWEFILGRKVGMEWNRYVFSSVGFYCVCVCVI